MTRWLVLLLGFVVAHLVLIGVAMALVVADMTFSGTISARALRIGVHRAMPRLLVAQAKADDAAPARHQMASWRDVKMTLTQTQWSPALRRTGSDGGAWRYTHRAQDSGYQVVASEDDTRGERRAQRIAYRTLCVRLCDGYYFPISFAVSRERFAKDARACKSRCGAEARLFVYTIPGGEPEDMRDLNGMPYRKLPTAFLYRTKYVPSCKCQPDPWEAAARERHRTYALIAAARNGDKNAAKELKVLQSGTKTGSGGVAQVSASDQASPPDSGSPDRATPAGAIKVERRARMSLGLEHSRGLRPSPPKVATHADTDWRVRVFNGNN